MFVKLGPCGKIYSSAFEVFIAGVLAQCAAWSFIMPFASKSISKEFGDWIAIAKDRPKWRQRTYSKTS